MHRNTVALCCQALGRPREHDERIRQKLLGAAEELLGAGGLEALSLRAVARRSGTTTRAVYSLFGSKDGLVEALALRALDLLVTHIAAVPLSQDPGADLVVAAMDGFRPYALAHPDLFRLVLVGMPGVRLSDQLAADRTTSTAFQMLVQRVERARQAGRLGNRPSTVVALQWNALCLGLASEELNCFLPAEHAEGIWRDSLEAFLAGLGGRP